MSGNNRLPDKPYYSLISLSAEWGTDVEHIIALLEQGEITPSIRLPPFAGERWSSTVVPVWIDSEYGWDWDGELEEPRVNLPAGIWLLESFESLPMQVDEGEVYLRATDLIVRTNTETYGDWFAFTETHDPSFERVNVKDLIVGRIQKEIFERTLDSSTAVSDVEIDTRERSTFLRMIAFLTRALVEESKFPGRETSKYVKPSGINTSAVAESVLRQMECEGYAGPPLADRTIRAKIAEALKLVKEDSIEPLD